MNNSDRQLLEMAKEKLQWYTLEASDEEFDVLAVDALVKLISTLEQSEGDEKKAQGEMQNSVQEIEKFREYCDWRMKDSEEPWSGNKDTPVSYPMKKVAAVIAAACICILIAVFGSLGVTNAGEKQGFFHWLNWDESGRKVVTVPDGINTVIEETVQYNSVEEMPEGEQHYITDMEKNPALEEYELEYIRSCKMQMHQRIIGKYSKKNDSTMGIELEIAIYEEQVVVEWERFDEYEFQYSEVVDGYEQGVFVKENVQGKKEYLLLFYEDNKKYFVSGNCSLEELKTLAKEYRNIIF